MERFRNPDIRLLLHKEKRHIGVRLDNNVNNPITRLNIKEKNKVKKEERSP